MDKKEIFRLNMVMPESMKKQIDDWRRTQADVPARSEAIRRLINIGLGKPPKTE